MGNAINIIGLIGAIIGLITACLTAYGQAHKKETGSEAPPSGASTTEPPAWFKQWTATHGAEAPPPAAAQATTVTAPPTAGQVSKAFRWGIWALCLSWIPYVGYIPACVGIYYAIRDTRGKTGRSKVKAGVWMCIAALIICAYVVNYVSTLKYGGTQG